MIHKFILGQCVECTLHQERSNTSVGRVMIPQGALCFIVAALLGMVVPALSGTVSANFTSASSIPVTASSYSATGNDVSISLSFTPPTGTNLTVVNNTGLGFITGQFSNLAQGQAVNLTYNGITYKFVANYYGGTGNDLVLQWACQNLVAWGYNPEGQLGNGTKTDSTMPVLVTQSGVLTGKTVVAISAGGDHSVALCSDGTVAAWGNNVNGQLGNNSTTSSSVPVLVTQNGVLVDKTVLAVAVGASHSLALCSDGTVAAWGYNGYGLLGNGTTSDSRVPVLVTQSGVLVDKTVVAVSAGNSHNLALCSDGTLAAWGQNTYGQLGNNSTINSSVPVAVTQSGVLADKTVVAVAAGSASFGNAHSLALCADGTVAAWGGNTYGKLGNNSTLSSSVPVLVMQSGVLEDKTVVAVCAGDSYNLALCSNGTVAAWGYNSNGQLGNGSTTNSRVPVLVTQSGVLVDKTVIAVAAGTSHSLALCSDGAVAAWGDNGFGQLGSGTKTDSSVPMLVSQSGVLGGKTVVAVTAAFWQSLVLAAVQNSCDLASVTLGSGTLNPFFDPAITAYSASVPYAVSSINAHPTSSVNIATIRVNGVTVTSGGTSQTIPLVVGANTITVLVTAPDGTTTKTYTVTVTRLPASTISTLSGLSTSSGTLSPTFSASTIIYTTNVANATTSLTVTPTVTDATATVKVNGITVSSGAASQTIPLVVGPNTISVVVTAQDGVTKTTYTVTVTRISTVSTLSGLVLNTGILSPAFSSSVVTYTARVSNATTSMTILPTVSDATATVKVNGITVTSGTNSQTVPLVVGPNAITTVVTAQDGTSIKTYTVTVTRLSAVSTLSGLVLNAGPLSPVFSSSTTAYMATVTAGFLTVTPTVTDAKSSVQVNGTAVTSGTPSGGISLSVGDNNISVMVTAEDGTQTSYTVTVTRLGTYDAWKETAFKSEDDRNNPAISGWQASPANDGIINLMKYALALDPITCSTGQLPTATPHEGYLTLTYRKNKRAADVTFTVLASDSLSGNGWNEATSVISQTDEGDYWLVTVRDTVPQAGHPTRFMRLKVEN